MRRVLSFGVQTSNENTFYVDLAGMPRDKVYFFRRADKDKGIEKDKKEVAWKDRLTYVAPEGYDMIGVKVGVTKKTNESGTSSTALTTASIRSASFLLRCL